MTEKKIFGWDTTGLEVVENVDLKGYEAIVTGGASGIGVETARALAKAGARVVIAARDLVKAQEVANNIIETTGNTNVEVEKLELDSLDSVHDFVKRYTEKERYLNILINNAGVMSCPLSYTKDGFEMQIGTNHIGHFSLTLGLISALKKGAEKIGKNSRVVNVSSLSHRLSDIHFDDINYRNRPYNDDQSYGQSKTANVLFSVELTKRYSKDGIVSNALMPGVIYTNIQRHLTLDAKLRRGTVDENGQFRYRAKDKTVQQGASTSVWAAVASELENVNGVYLEDCTIAEIIPSGADVSSISKGCLSYALDSDNAAKLWQLTENMINDAKTLISFD